MCTERMLVWTAAAVLFFLFGVPATADDRAFDIPIQQGQGVSGNVKLHVSKSAGDDLVVTVDAATITYMPKAGFNGLDETGGNLEIQGLLLVPQFSADGAGGETRVLVPFANLQKRGATYSCTACGEGVLPNETLAGSDSVIPAMVVSGLIIFMPQENLAAGVEEPQTKSSNDVTAESSAQRLAIIARAANLPIASLPNLRDLQSEDYSVLESLLSGIKDETGLDGIAKSILASAAAQAANMAYSPVLKKLVLDRFGLQSQIILKGFKANPMEYYGEASDSIGIDLAKGIAIGIAGSMVADAVFSLKPLSDLPPNWKEPMRAMTKATVVETINLGTSAVDPSVAAAGIANRLYEFYQIYKASVALADTQNEAIVAAAIGLETAARLVTLNPSEKNNEIARSTISSTVANLNEAFGDGYSVAMTEIVNLTFVGLLSEFRGDTDRATQMVVHIREKGELGSNDAFPDVIARPINWIASFATWSGDPPSRVAALMISTTALSNLTQMSAAKISEEIASPASGDWIETESASTTLRPGEKRDGLEIAADGVVKYWAAPVFSRVVASTNVELRLFSSPDRTHAVAVQWDLDRGGVRAALLDIVGRRVIRNDLIPEAAVHGLGSPESVRIAMLPVAWSPEGRYVAFPISSTEWQADPMLVNGQSGASTVLLTDDLAHGSWVFPDLATARWGAEDWMEMSLTVIRCNDAECTTPVETGKVEASYRVSTLFDATTEQPQLVAKPASETTKDVWGPDIVPEVEVGYNPCGDRKADDTCLQALGLSDAAIAFSAAISEDYSGFAVAASFQDLGMVDLAVVLYQGASSWYVPVLLNGQPDLVIPQDTADLLGTFVDPESRRLLRQFPNAASSATGYYAPVSSHRTLDDGTQRFARIEMVTEGCRACAPIGTAITFLDIGPATGGKILRRPIGIGFDPALPGMDLEVTPQVMMETSAILQLYLNKLGYDAGSMDGRPGPRTRQALIEFQAEHCLPSTGHLDTATATALLGADGFSVPCKSATLPSGSEALLSDGADLINIYEHLQADGPCGDEPCSFSGTEHDYVAYPATGEIVDYALAKQIFSMIVERGGSGAMGTGPAEKISVDRPIGEKVRKSISSMLVYRVERADCSMEECPWAVVAAYGYGPVTAGQSLSFGDGYFIDMAPVGSASKAASPLAEQQGVSDGDPIETALQGSEKSEPSCNFDEVVTEPNGCSACISRDGADRVGWTGQCKDGRIDGDGVLEWYKGKDLQWLMTASKFQAVRDGSIFVDYNAEGAYRISYFDTNGNTVAGCVPEPSGNSFKMPFVNVTVARDFPLHREDARLAIMSKIQNHVSGDCLVGIKAVSSGFTDIDRVKIALQLKQDDVYLKLNCGFQGTRIDEINECFSNGNPWGQNFSQEIYNINTSREQDERVREEERLKAVETAEADAFKREMDTLKAQIDRDWNAKLAAIASNREIAIPNLADFARSNPASLISMMAPNRRISFTPRTLNMRDGKVVVAMQMSPTPIYAQIEAQVAARRTGWDQWFADIDRASRSESYNVTCLVDPSEAELFGKQRNMYVIASLVSLQGQNIVLQCSTK